MHSSRIVIIFILMLANIGLIISHVEFVYGQQEEYYQNYEDEPQFPEYQDPGEYGDDYIDQPQNPDPEFMEEIEPGEYNQSDDTTELNDDY